MTPLEMIAEWRKGCSCAPAGKPEECSACTRGLIDALEQKLKHDSDDYSHSYTVSLPAYTLHGHGPSILDTASRIYLNDKLVVDRTGGG